MKFADKDLVDKMEPLDSVIYIEPKKSNLS